MKMYTVIKVKGKRLVLHFDGKLVKELSEEKNIPAECERIAIR